MNSHLAAWVPPLLLDRRKLMDTVRNPFYRHAEAEFFIAERHGVPAGRIAAIINHNHNAEHGENVGFFGFFECADDQEVADALFGAALGWLRAGKVTAARGPANPSVNDEYGLLVEGFDDPPTVIMSYNPPYYGKLIERAGFTKKKDLYTYELRKETFISDKLERVTSRLKEREGLTIRPMDVKNFWREVATIKDLYARAWQRNWGAVPMTDEEFDSLAKDLKSVLNPELILFAEFKGEPVGFALSLPDLNQALKYNKRGWLLTGLFCMFFFRKKINRVRILVLGVLPERLKTGAGSLLMYETGKRANALGYPVGEAGWILEDNVMMNRAAQFMNGKRTKVYRIYEKSI
jgi:GNAT superfamily N-acetyltransferase